MFDSPYKTRFAGKTLAHANYSVAEDRAAAGMAALHDECSLQRENPKNSG